MTEKLYDILYNGRKIYKNLSPEDCTEVISELYQKHFSGENIDPNLIEMEEKTNG
jgi:(2Fe-2S) ferredoxin